jgi:hypothetical protein
MTMNCISYPLSIIAVALVLVFLIQPGCSSAQAEKPEEVWNLTYGGRYADVAWCLQETGDGGNILVGNSASRGEGSDLLLIRTDATGKYLWGKVWGGSGEDVGYFVQETKDGGFIVTGSSKSFSMGEELLWLVKTDVNGSISWDKTFGGFVSSSGDGGWSVDETDDGGFITTGYTQSQGRGRKDLWLLKTDATGSKMWDRTFGGKEDDVGMSVLQSRDGGYIVAGRTASFSKGGDDIWLLKTDSRGVEQWNVTFGGKKDDAAFQVVETEDGYALVGRTESGSDKNKITLIKVNPEGRKRWEKIYRGSSSSSLQSTNDGGYIIAGRIDNKDTGRDALIIKTNSAGSEEWSMILGGKEDDIGTYAIESIDGSYTMAGITSSFGQGREDVWLIKIRDKKQADNNETQLRSLIFPGPESSNLTLSQQIQSEATEKLVST